MKKILSFVLALIMIVSCMSLVAADDTAIAEDVETVDAGAYSYAIEFLTQYGIYKGGEPETADIQRYQMALFVARIATGWTDDATWEDGSLNSSEFVDIDTAPANEYYGAISYVNQMGIIEGYGDGNFGPYDGITYQDALTMLVRTLGWNNLKYPWGVIEQAIKLGLTDGIEGVAYTDTLTRAEVAQLVYNALFINGKDGLTLAQTSFDMEEGWKTVIITGAPNGNIAGDAVAGGKVGFRVLNADGSMGNTLYVAPAADFGFSGNDAAMYLGHAYKVIFEANSKNIAKVLASKSLYMDTIWNNGATDDNGKYQVNAVESFLATQKIVSKYSDTDEYYYGQTYAQDQFILLSGEETYGTKTVATDKARYGINWTTGDIVELTWNGNVASIKDVLWYYQPELDTYFQYKFDASGETVVTHYMTEADYAVLPELLKEVVTQEISVAGRYMSFTLGEMTYHSAYASLELFDTNEDGTADRGIYEYYFFGRVNFSTQSCATCKKGVPAVTFTNIGNEPCYRVSDSDWYTAAMVNFTLPNFNIDGERFYAGIEGGYAYHDASWAKGSFQLQSDCGHTGRYWFNPNYEVSGNCIGMFKWDSSTGEIKVIKTVEDKANTTDVDTYISKGMVRAWSFNKASVTIVDEDGTETAFNVEYKDLWGYERHWFARYTTAHSAEFCRRMEKYFMNYVNYVVVDGKLVSIWLDGADSENVIVVDEYLGLDSEHGLITVAGYSTADGKRKEYKLLSVDAWVSGDWYNTSNNDVLAAMAKTFTQGALLVVTSYDKELKAYNVDLAGQYDKNGNFVIDTTTGLTTSYITLDFAGSTHGYYYKNGSLSTGAADVEVIAIQAYNPNYSTTVGVFKGFGAGQEGWHIEGTKINSAGNRHVIIYDKAKTVGFAGIGGGNISIVQIYGMAGAGYTEWIRNGYYIAGSTETTYMAMDMASGDDISVTALNKKIVANGLYITHNNQIVCSLDDTGSNPIKILGECYGINAATFGDGVERTFWEMKNITGDYNHTWFKQHIMLKYAAEEFAKLQRLYGGTDLYSKLYGDLEASFFVGYAQTNSAGVKMFDVNTYGTTGVRFFLQKTNADGSLDKTWGDNNSGIKVTRLGSSYSPWTETIWVGGTWTFYAMCNTRNGKTVFFGDVAHQEGLFN